MKKKDETIKEKVDVVIKKDLVNQVWLDMRNNNRNINRGDIQAIVDFFIDNIRDNVISGNTVQIRGFLKIDHVYTPERPTYNYVTNEPAVVKAHNRLRVKPAISWRRAVAESNE